MRQVKVVTYNKFWPETFESEAANIKEALNHIPLHIYHIGSTAVPGLEAKPVLDIMPVVPSVRETDYYTDAMETLGYEAMGEYDIEGRRFFKKGEYLRTHHVHVFERSSPHVERHLAFREYLIAHPHMASTYGQLKRNLSLIFPGDMESYIKGKNDWIREMEKKAIRWYREEREI